ncbi:Exocyst complex component 1 [Borealophlyctis nickersoniae]|nr:Exocyst complex component 1 [Borealophlyctis nickersoniae]
MTDATVRQALATQLFVGFGGTPTVGTPSSATRGDSSSRLSATEGSTDRTNEKLLQQWKVREDDRGGKGKGSDDDDDGGAKGKGGKGAKKVRYICITVKKNMKIRVHKVKSKGGTFAISKTWGLDDIKSIESCEDTRVDVNLGKTYRWYMDDMGKKVEFMYTLIKLCRRYLKRLPKLVNITEESLKNDMNIDASYMSATEKEFTTTLNTMMARPRGVNFEEEEEVPEEEPEYHPPDQDAQPTVNLDEVLSDFNWHASGDAADLEARLLTELQALEAANVHAIIQSEDQANLVVEQLEGAILQLDQIDEWLGHYTHLLDSMGQDVHQIEIQTKGMQIASANQKLLLQEVQKLLTTLRLPGFIVEILRNEPLDDPDGIAQCEEATERLAEVINRKFDDGLGDMQAIKERVALYNGYGNQFAARLHNHLKAYFQSQAELYLQDKNRTSKRGSLKLYGHETIEERLYRFRNLLRWLKDVDTRKHYELQMVYVQEMNRVYKREIREFMEQLRVHHVKKLANEDQEYVFSQQSVSVSLAASNALKSAMNRSQNNLSPSGSFPSPDSKQFPSSASSRKLGDSWRPGHRRKGTRGDSDSFTGTDSFRDDEDDGDDSGSIRGHRRGISETYGGGKGGTSLVSLDVGADEKMAPDEAVGHALSMLAPIMVREQNFISDLFGLHHKSRNFTGSATDLLSPSPATPAPPTPVNPNWQHELDRPREPIRDVKVQKRIHELVEGMFQDLREEMLTMIESSLKYDQTYAVSIMVRIEEYIDEHKNTGHTYIVALLDGVHKKLTSIFEKFVDEQIRGIDETNVTSKKRSGILLFVRTFPRFVDRMERCLGGADGPARKIVDKAYAGIVSKIFETLEEVGQQVANDPKSSTDDKEHLNVHILNVENMHHFYSEVRARKVPTLDTYVKQAKSAYDVNLDAYCKVVIRKPLGKLWDFFEGIDALLKTNTPEEVSYHVQFSKTALKDVVKKYPGKEIKKGLELLYKRVVKHYTDEEGLLQVVWRGIQEEVTRRLRRYEDIIAQCYPETSIRLEFTMDELLGYFSELARAH